MTDMPTLVRRAEELRTYLLDPDERERNQVAHDLLDVWADAIHSTVTALIAERKARQEAEAERDALRPVTCGECQYAEADTATAGRPRWLECMWTKANTFVEAVSMPQNTIQIARARQLCRTGRARMLRKAATVSLSELARDVGVSTAAVSGWEMGRFLPRGEHAVRLALVLERLEREVRR